MSERGVVQGINFSGSRIGAALALPVIGAMVAGIGWRTTFCILMVIGFVWALIWYWGFRDDPTDDPGIHPDELAYIKANRQKTSSKDQPEQPLSLGLLLGSMNVWLVSAQYFCSNFTFFFCLTWLFPHLKEKYELTALQAGIYASAPLYCGAFGNWFAGFLVDLLYRMGSWNLSRRLPAIAGYLLAAVGLIGSVFADSPLVSILWFCLAIFGADMTLAPSWSLCIDIGKRHAGVVSGTMNMAGNIGSFVTALAFPYLAAFTGSYTPFFYVAAGLNGLAIALWMLIRPDRSLEEY
jgi:ACS family glucarate transporter-like MFS transporter